MRRQTLTTQILALNAVLILATTLAGIAAARLSIGDQVEQQQALIIVVGIFAAVLVNGLVLRRRFSGLERLITLMEDVDLSRPGLRAQAEAADTLEVTRLCQAFNRMLARVEDERARTGAAVLAGQEQERGRLARDLHDECNQALTGILLRLQALSERVDGPTRDELQTIKALTTTAMDELLGLARELRPTALDDHGLRVALQAQVERVAANSGLVVQMVLDDEAPAALGALTEQQQIVVYRIVQEALSNAVQHAQASEATVRIATRADGLPLITIEDDGTGFPAEPSEGLGLVGMRERARLAGGQVRFRPRAAGGTVVTLDLADHTAKAAA